MHKWLIFLLHGNHHRAVSVRSEGEWVVVGEFISTAHFTCLNSAGVKMCTLFLLYLKVSEGLRLDEKVENSLSKGNKQGF